MDIQVVLIILGILYYLFRPSGKKKSAPQQGGRQAKQDAPTTSLEDILRELTGQGQKSAPTPAPQASPEPTRKVRRPDRVKVVETPVEREIIRSHRNTPRIQAKPIMLEEDSSEDFDFDLRQAVINEAILNRPY